MNYHLFTVDFLMRDCDNLEDARTQLMSLLPQYPDDDVSHNMESWLVVSGIDLQTKERWMEKE